MVKKATDRKRGSRDPLAPPIRAFAEGNYVAARTAFDRLKEDANLSPAERETAEQLANATRIDPFTAWVGLGCLGVFTLAVLLTSLIQP